MSTSANDVCRRAWLSNGEIRTAGGRRATGERAVGEGLHDEGRGLDAASSAYDVS